MRSWLLVFIKGLFVIVIQKKIYPYFHIKVISKVMLVPRAKVTTSNSIIRLKHSVELLECYKNYTKNLGKATLKAISLTMAATFTGIEEYRMTPIS